VSKTWKIVWVGVGSLIRKKKIKNKIKEVSSLQRKKERTKKLITNMHAKSSTGLVRGGVADQQHLVEVFKEERVKMRKKRKRKR